MAFAGFVYEVLFGEERGDLVDERDEQSADHERGEDGFLEAAYRGAVFVEGEADDECGANLEEYS